MAKGNFIVGKMIGSVGDVTAYARGNDQIVRRRNRYVKNPRTQAQTINRIIAATIGSAYSRLSAIADHSFQGHSTKADSMARFLKANQGFIRSTLASASDAFGTAAFQAIGQKGIVANPYIVSEGTLPHINVVGNIPDGIKDNPAFAVNGPSETIPTYQEICDALHLQRGDQISFVALLNSDRTEDEATGFYEGTGTYLEFARVILDPVNAEGVSQEMSTAFLDANSAINMANPRNKNTAAFSFIRYEDFVVFRPKAYDPGSNNLVAFTMIASRKEGTTWMRSMQQLVVSPFWEGHPTLQQAIDASYPSTGAIADPSKFLNAALQG